MNMQEAQQKSFEAMTTAPVHHLILKLSVPAIISMIISSVYNMADTYFVSQLGTSVSGAVGIVFSLMAMIQAIGYCLSMGSGSYISRLLGAKNGQMAEKVLATAIGTALLLGLVLSIVGLIFAGPIVRMMGATPTIEPYAKSYASIILIGAPYMAATFVFNNSFRSQGRAMLGTIGMSVGAILNVILDPIFIYGFQMGISGAALATIISQFIGFITLFTLYKRTPGLVELKIRNFKPSLKIYKEVLRTGQSSLYRQVLSSISTICINLFAAPYGDAAIAALSIVSRCFSFCMSVVYGFGHALQPVCGYNYGAGLYHRVMDAFWFCVKLSTTVLIITAIIGFTFATGIMGIFRADDRLVISIGSTALRILCLILPFMGWLWPCQMLMQALGKGMQSAILSIMQQGACFLVYIFILPHILGLLGVQLSMPLSLLTTSIVAVPLCWGVLRTMTQKKAKVKETVKKGV